MSELGLGFEEERRKKRRKKKQLKLNSKSQDIGEILMQEEEEQVVIDETLNSAINVDLEQVQEETPDPPKEKFGNQWVNSEIHRFAVNKQRYPRTASLDLNCHNAAILSPQFFVGGGTGLEKSPWTPNYQKGWSSERVPLPTSNRQRYLCNGKALPSKWEDAERWIRSPVSIDTAGRLVLPSYYRRPKSKSGPLGAHSPLGQCFDSGRVVNVAASSPFLAGVLVADRQCYGSARRGAEGRGGGSFVSVNVEPYAVQQSAAMHGWSDLSSQDEKLDSKGSLIVSPKVFQKDVSTQMSPAGSTHTSPDKTSLSTVRPSADPTVKLEDHFSKLEIRDVQVDGQSTLTGRPKKHVSSDRCLRNIIEWKNKTEEDKVSAWEVEEPSKFLSKHSREEAKIAAWRKLQEAKAEEAIRKLEMKLEKERSSSMDKILNKLRSIQKKAEDMQNAVRASEAHQTERTSRRASFLIRSVPMSFLRSCFTCPAS